MLTPIVMATAAQTGMTESEKELSDALEKDILGNIAGSATLIGYVRFESDVSVFTSEYQSFRLYWSLQGYTLTQTGDMVTALYQPANIDWHQFH